MFTRLGWFTVRRRRLLLVLTVLFIVAAGVIGGGAFGVLKGGGFDDPSSESAQAAALLENRFGSGDPNVVLLVTADGGDVDAPAAATAGTDLTNRLAAEAGLSQVASYWTLGSPPPLRSDDGAAALVVGRIAGDEDVQDATFARIKDAFEGDQGDIDVRLGGQLAVFADISETIEGDLGRAEAIAIPLTLALLVVVFGSLVAAGLPLLVGVVAVMGTFLVLFVLGSLTDVSIYSINLTTALGLGLAIDYSLFIVSRFREELRNGLSPHDAVVRTVETAGRTVAFSALTVAVSLSALLVFPQYFLRSFAYAGVAVVVLAMVASIICLPALLAVLGHRVDSLRIIKRRERPEGSGFWHRLATLVMKRPIPVATIVIAVLLLLGAPFLRVAFGSPDDRALPASAPSRQVSEVLRSEFTGNAGESFAVVMTGFGESNDARSAISTFAASVSSQDSVARVEAVTGTYAGGQQVAPPDAASGRFAADGGGWFSVVPSVPLTSPEGEDLVRDIRRLDAPFQVAVEGAAAELVDTKASIVERLPWAVLLIVATTMVLLFLMTGSVLVPVKAIVMNLLSLTATFGAMVWIFQYGNGSDFLGFTATGTLDVSMPILMFCIAFGLSMDYEVFLLSRIKEEYDRTGNNTEAVALGLERTGRIVTAAAALLAITFVAFATSGVSFIKMFGLGLALAVVMDATIIRGLLVPAVMRLAGDANWWAPAPLRRLHQRIGLSESGPASPAEAELETAGRP